ncbi:MAG TPA: NAD(P)/FAD-dependent oxidoreductase [Thermoanaerobaculia bacterium]|jgi:monoamine oxidase
MPGTIARRFDIAVIGAGAAGLAAAARLTRAGATVALIEARARLGGRIWTRRREGWPVPLELGPEFVHGRDAKFFGLLEEANLPVVRLPDAHVRRVGSRLEPLADTWGKFDAITRRIGRSGKDRSVAEELRRRHAAFSTQERRLLTTMVEGYDAAPVEKASAHALSTAGEPRAGDDDDEFEQFRPIAGYGALVDWLLARVDPSRGELFRSTVVSRIAWSRRAGVRLVTSKGDLRARRVLVTAPIGVLRAPAGNPGAIAFDPDPPALRRALSGLAMGDVVRLVLRFREPFWRDAPRVRRSGVEDPNFFHLFTPEFPTWWTSAPVESPVLVAWSGGTAASSLRRLPRTRIVRRALETLSEGIDVPLPRVARQLLDWDLHDWTGDPFTRGAYSYALVGGATAGRRLMRPIEDTLFFAGEAIGEGDSGTVPAAIASGERAAKQILR